MGKLEIVIGDEKTVSREVAARVAAEIREAQFAEKEYVLACSKGSSPVEFYSVLRKYGTDFRGIHVFFLDEDFGKDTLSDYAQDNFHLDVQIHKLHSRLYKGGELVDSSYLQKRIEDGRAFVSRGMEIVPDKLAVEIAKRCNEYEREFITLGGIDTAIIGLGVNPMHIASNFPPTCRESRTHLAHQSSKDGRYTGYALTMGISNICSARKAFVFAFGEKKAHGVKEFLEADISVNSPPTFLREMNNLTVVLDSEAASLIDKRKLGEIYKEGEVGITSL